MPKENKEELEISELFNKKPKALYEHLKTECSEKETPGAAAQPPSHGGPSQPAVVPPLAGDPCRLPRIAAGSSHEVVFRVPLAIQAVSSRSVGDFGGVTGEARSFIVLDHLVTQRWAYVDTFRYPDADATVGLEPAARRRIAVTRTQRTRLDQRSVESTEALRSVESLTHDKEVMNVARTSSRSRTWKVDGGGRISLGGIASFGSNFSTGGQVGASTQRSIQNLHEQTQRSTQTLKLLQKIELGSSEELALEEKSVHEIANPYRDRTLLISAFPLGKRYEVSYGAPVVQVALAWALDKIEVTPQWISDNVDFLTHELVDRDLARSLPAVLEGIDKAIPSHTASALAEKYAGLALETLFGGEEDIFRFAGNEVRTIDESFNGASTSSGFDDAVKHHAANVFAALAAYWRLYKAGELDPHKIAVALAISETIRDEWRALSHGRLKNLLDKNNRTEVLRRIPGFLSISEHLLRPQVDASPTLRHLPKPAFTPSSLDANSSESGADEDDVDPQFVLITEPRSKSVIFFERLTRHITCHMRYYATRWLHYVFSLTGGTSARTHVREFFEADVQTQDFDFDGAFVDDNAIIVPTKTPFDSTAMMKAFGYSLHMPAPEQVDVPTDGFHLEATAGGCVLDGIPASETSIDASVNLSSGPKKSR